MELPASRKRKAAYLTAAMLCSLLWLGYQIFLWNYASYNITYARKIMEPLGISILNRDTEWRRFLSVLRYLQTLPHVLLAYCLFNKWTSGKKSLRVLPVVVVFCLSLLAIPQIALLLFPSYKNILSPNSPDYFKVLRLHGLIGLSGVLIAFFIDTALTLTRKNKSLFQPKAIGNRAAQYILTAFISLLMAVCYGWILSILNHFSPSSVTYILKAFSPDSKLIYGIITMLILAPVMEEMAFRGLILTKTRQFSSTWFAVVFSSILFGLWHRNLGQFFATTSMGIVFSWIYLKTGKLRCAMLSHCLSNLFLALSLTSTGGYLPEVEVLQKLRTTLLSASLPVGIIGLIATAALIALLITKGYPRFSEKEL